jgi:dynein heavy chain, axonemal
MIWELSQYYNTTDRICGLLNKISNEIIKRCRDKIVIEDMLDGDVEKCMSDLDESIVCGEKWKTIFQSTIALINKECVKLDFGPNHGSIFAQIDAFVQRCRDLKEICEGQLQFARKGADMTLPEFGGTKGPEIATNLQQLQENFKKHLDKIRHLNYHILDVKVFICRLFN